MCHVHGGSAPQVALAARRRVLQERLMFAYLAWRDGPRGQPGSMREATALGRIAIAERELEDFERDVMLIKLMRAELADPDPETTAMLRELVQSRLARR